MASKLVLKVTPQLMSYFYKKMYLELFNLAILKAAENAEKNDYLSKNFTFSRYFVQELY